MSAPVSESVEDPIEIPKRSPSRDVEIHGVKNLGGADSPASARGREHRPAVHGLQHPARRAAGHATFTNGRHTCRSAPLTRLRGATGLLVLFEQLPTLASNPTSRWSSRLLRFYRSVYCFKLDGDAGDHRFSTPMGGDNV
jgi:cytochrome P450